MNELNMADHLGRGIRVYFKDGTAIDYRPLKYIKSSEKWEGIAGNGHAMTVFKRDVDFIRVVR